MPSSVIGKCKLCGKETTLTFEHVPPEASFNSTAVKVLPISESLKAITGEEGRMPWDFSGLRGTINQRGGGEYYLCSSCNSNTGSWYMSEYAEFAKIMHCVIQRDGLTTGSRYAFQVKEIHPLRILKAIMTMFCDINNECFGDRRLRKFLLEKESTRWNINKYSVYMYLVSPDMRRIIGLSAKHTTGFGMAVLSEIACYPLGMTLVIDKPDNYAPPGLLINDFLDCKYDEVCNVNFNGIPYYEINSQFPTDFRAKGEFQRT